MCSSSPPKVELPAPPAHRRARPDRVLDNPFVDEALPRRSPNCNACESDKAAALPQFFVAKKKFDAVDPNFLSFEKNDILRVFSTEGRFVKARSRKGTVGNVPLKFLEPYSIDKELWYHPSITRQVADDILTRKGCKDGVFEDGVCLVRKRFSEANQWALSMVAFGEVIHYIIKQDQETGLFSLQGEESVSFQLICDLLPFHAAKEGILKVPLTAYVRRASSSEDGLVLPGHVTVGILATPG